MKKVTKGTQKHYYILSGIQLDFNSFDLGHGVTLSSAYLHLMSHPVLAFKRARPGKHHPEPWQPVEASPGTTSIDLYAQLALPSVAGDKRAHLDHASWIAFLLRFATDTTVTITLSSLTDVRKLRAGEARARLMEPIRRLHEGATVARDTAEWVKDNWHSSLHLSQNEALMFALGAIYHSHRQVRNSAWCRYGQPLSVCLVLMPPNSNTVSAATLQHSWNLLAKGATKPLST